VEERNRCQIAGLVMVLENDVHIGRMELEMALEIHTHCVLGASAKVLSNRIHYALVELEKVHGSHSHVFEGRVLSQYYRERS
jgi:hypothetical protein